MKGIGDVTMRGACSAERATHAPYRMNTAGRVPSRTPSARTVSQ